MRQQRRNLVTSTTLDPGTLPGLELRFLGTTNGGADDSVVTTWTDSSGNGRDAGQTNATEKPRVTISGNANNPYSPTGQKGVAFNFGENDHMTGSISFDYTQGMTAYAWVNESPFGGIDQTLWCPDTSSPELLLAGAAGKVGYGDADGEHESTTDIKGVSAFHHLAWVFYPPATGTGVVQIYQSGSVIHTGTWRITASATAYTLGNSQPLTQPFGGSIYELCFFSRPHNPGAIESIRQYGRARWGF